MEELPYIGDWVRERSLGSGGFGTVILWKNNRTKEAIAVKKCNLLTKNDSITDRQKERWQYEVQLMTTKIQCENIVKTVSLDGLSQSFKDGLQTFNPSGLPILAMEYCEGGDLRRVLSKSSNCSGLPEADVRAVLRALRNAISYLHDMKITHRDIKPENIVLKKTPEGNFVYKITDLGYAKLLDRQSLQASIVGTMEYLAPELLLSDKYSCSVDYWSLGLIAFEICCGYRPFLPHASVARWMLNVKNKKSQHICITEDNAEGVYYHTEIFSETKLSSRLKECLEKWLVLALEWNPKQRGCVFESQSAGEAPVQVLKIFSVLDEILSKKIITVFSLFGYKFLSYEISEPKMVVADLRKLISAETRIPAEELEFILPCYQAVDRLDDGTLLEEIYMANEYERPMIYLSRRGMILDRNVKPAIPKLLVSVFENPTQSLKYHTVKQLASNAYYFMRQEQRLYLTALDGLHNLSLQLNHEVVQQKARMNLVVERVFEAKGSLDVVLSSLKRTKLAGVPVEDLLEEAIQLAANLMKVVEATRKIRTRYESVLKRSLEVVIENKKFFNGPPRELFSGNALNDQYDLVRHQLVEKKINEKTHSGLVKLTYNCLKERDIVLGDRDFLNLQQSLLELKKEQHEIIKAMGKAVYQVDRYKTMVYEVSDRHQKRILGDNSDNGFGTRDDIAITRNSSTSSLPRVIEFQIDDPETMSLIDENSNLLDALGNLLRLTPTSEL